MEIDRRKFFKSVGGAAAVALMTSEQKADALEHFMEEELEEYALEQARQAVTGTYVHSCRCLRSRHLSISSSTGSDLLQPTFSKVLPAP